MAGTIIDLGENTVNWNIGDEVCTLVNGGGYAEYCLSHQGQTLRFPQGFDAIKLLLSLNLFSQHGLISFKSPNYVADKQFWFTKDQSGVGIAAIQLAVSCGATVYTTARDQKKNAYPV